MHITILEAGDLPKDAYLSVRVGETKRLRPFKAGEGFTFKGGDASGFIQLDAYEKLGSLMTRGPSDSPDSKEPAKDMLQEVTIPTAHGQSISAKIKVSLTDPPPSEKREKLQTRHKIALDAKNYLDCNDIWGPIQGMLHALLKHRPQDPVGYMITYLSDAQRSRVVSRGDGESPSAYPRKDLDQLLVPPLAPEKSAPPPEAAQKAAPPPQAAEKAAPPAEAAGKAAAQCDGSDETAPAKQRVRRGLLAGFQDGSLQKLATSMQADQADDVVEEAIEGFPVDACPGSMPDLSNHHSLMAEVLRANPGIYTELKDLRTGLGVSFARCVKPGMDSPGDADFRTVGAVAGDEACYDVFKELFSPIIDSWHGAQGADARHTTDLNLDQVTSLPIDPTGRYALSTRVRGGRSFRGLRFSPACDHQERCKVEQLVSEALSNAKDDDLRGEYFPLTGSTTFASKPRGMSQTEASDLERHRLLFEKPDSSEDVSAGFASGWPQARGVFASKSRKLAVWCNEKEHLRVVSLEMGQDLSAAFSRFVRTVSSIEQSAKESGHAFAHSDRLGFLSSCPSNLGTGLRISVMMRLPLLTQQPALEQVCESLGLQVQCHSDDTCEVNNRERLGISEVDLVNKVIEGCARLVALEQKLEQEEGEGEEWVGEQDEDTDWCPGRFPRHSCPEELPDISGHSSMMADVLRSDAGIYERLKDQRTKLGVSLATCIKSGIDNPSHPMLMAIGAVAGDEECYDTFKELFDPIVQSRHGKTATGPHPHDLTPAKVTETPIDPSGKYAISVRIRGHRSLSGLRLPAACDRAERIEVERALSKALLSVQDEDLKGAYYPLRDSCSYPQKPNGMTEAEEEELQARSILFLEPDSSVMLCSGLGRDWPEARGVFAAESGKMAAWLNEEDHLRLLSMQMGGGLKEAFDRFVRAVSGIDGTLASDGYRFARSDRLGYLSTCPSNLGTGIRASVLLRLPLLCRHPSFQETCQKLGVQACSRVHSTNGESIEPGVCDVANRDRFGISEVELVNGVIEACAKLVQLEEALERGEEI